MKMVWSGYINMSIQSCMWYTDTIIACELIIGRKFMQIVIIIISRENDIMAGAERES